MRALLWALIINLMLIGVVCTALAIGMSISLARRGSPRPRWTRSVGWCRALAVVALVLVALPVGFLLLVPVGSSSTTTSTTEVTSMPGVTTLDWVTSDAGSMEGSVEVTASTESVTLVENEGTSVLYVLAFPVLVAGMGTAIRGRWEHPVRVVCGWALLGGSFLAILSIGLLFLPAAAVLTIAGTLTPSVTTRTRVSADRGVSAHRGSKLRGSRAATARDLRNLRKRGGGGG